MKFIIAEKIEMTQRFQEDGTAVPVTLLKAEPSTVTQVKTQEKDGYDAVQVGHDEVKKANKTLSGHLKSVGKLFRTLKEFRTEGGATLAVGDQVGVSQFAPGEYVKVTGTSKGKGFQGVVKRHGFSGSPASHGHKDQLRMPGSIGATGPARVFKGTRMGGNMGNEQVTVTNLQIVDIDEKTNVIAVKGAVPGARGSQIVITGGTEKRQSWK